MKNFSASNLKGNIKFLIKFLALNMPLIKKKNQKSGNLSKKQRNKILKW